MFFASAIVKKAKAGCSAQKQIRSCHRLEHIRLPVFDGIIQEKGPAHEGNDPFGWSNVRN